MIKRAIAMLAMTATVAVAADDKTTEYRLAEELLEIMNVKANIEESFQMVKQMIPAQARQYNADADTSGAESMIDMIMNEMSWENLKDDYIAVYAETFTADELQGLVDFYRTPVGQRFIEKQPELRRRSMEISQKQMALIMPKIRAMQRDTRGSGGSMPLAPMSPMQ